VVSLDGSRGFVLSWARVWEEKAARGTRRQEEWAGVGVDDLMMVGEELSFPHVSRLCYLGVGSKY